MPKRLQWFPFYAADWLLSPRVRRMTFEQRGVYFELLCWQFHEGSLPVDVETMARMIGAPLAPVEAVVDQFPKVNQSLRRNPRLEEVINEQKSLSRKRSTSGKAGAAKRKQNAQSANGKPMQRERQTDKGEPSARTNASEVLYECDDCEAKGFRGWTAYSRHLNEEHPSKDGA